jgi:hypothetical protein
MFQKQNNYRNRKLLDLAHRVNECQFQIPGICIGYSVEGCEPAHSNKQEHGKGWGLKSGDNYHVASCAPCHREYDSGTQVDKDIKDQCFNAGMSKTIEYYFKQGWLKVL